MKASQRKAVTIIVFAVIAGLLGWRLYVWGTTPRQTAVRAIETGKLKKIELCIRMYVSDNKQLPRHISELKRDFPKFSAEFNELEQCMTPEGNLLIYRREVFRRIKKGEPVGSLEDYAEADIPPARAYMIIDGSDASVKNGELKILEGPISIKEADFSARFFAIINPQ